MTIRFVKHSDIEPSQWNSAIMNSRVPLVYALYEYLNEICDRNWGALIFGDYEAVFPLPMKSKWGITYIVQPIFCQQLGAFGSNKNISTQAFIDAIPRRFLRVRLQLNPYFDVDSPPSLPTKINFLLPLSSPPTYNKDCRKNLATLAQLPIVYAKDGVSLTDAISVYKSAWGGVNTQLHDEDYMRFERACWAIKESNGAAFVISAKNETTQCLLGTAILLSHPRIAENQECHFHYVCAGPTAAGKTLGIMHGIIDHVIQTHQGKNRFFDFEGSSIPSVASFYKKFGPTDKPFFLFKRGI